MNEENFIVIDDVEIYFNCAIEALEDARREYMSGNHNAAYEFIMQAQDFIYNVLEEIQPADEMLRHDKTKRVIEWEALRVLAPFLKENLEGE